MSHGLDFSKLGGLTKSVRFFFMLPVFFTLLPVCLALLLLSEPVCMGFVYAAETGEFPSWRLLAQELEYARPCMGYHRSEHIRPHTGLSFGSSVFLCRRSKEVG